jgi:16S rRNA (guanine966-N2)-methyltransferase
VFARLPDLAGARVLDLFAGTGALGIEALSRGAAAAAFVERAGPALACLEANLASLGLAERSRVLRGAVHGALARLAREQARFDLVLVDPPYGTTDTAPALRALADAELLAPGGTLVLETSRRHPPERVPGLVLADERRYGDTLVARYVRADAPGDAAGERDAGAAGREGGA